MGGEGGGRVSHFEGDIVLVCSTFWLVHTESVPKLGES